jgi:hypothetical protein
VNKTILLLGRKRAVVEDVRQNLSFKNVTLLVGTSLDDVRTAFAEGSIDVVIMGAGIELKTRLEIVNQIFTASNSTTVHMKELESGPSGMLPFVDGVLKGLLS